MHDFSDCPLKPNEYICITLYGFFLSACVYTKPYFLPTSHFVIFPDRCLMLFVARHRESYTQTIKILNTNNNQYRLQSYSSLI
jgi:hypothetical protein